MLSTRVDASNDVLIKALDNKVLDLISNPILSGKYQNVNGILTYAAYFGWINTVDFLLKNNAKANEKAEYFFENTVNADNKKLGIIRRFDCVLKDLGILDIEKSVLEMIKRNSPFFLAATKGHEGIIALLKDNGAKPETILNIYPVIYTLVESKNYNAMRVYIQLSADIDATDHYGNTALHRAAWHGDIKAAKILVEAGAKLTMRATGNGDKLPIDCASRCPEMIQYLNDQMLKK